MNEYLIIGLKSIAVYGFIIGAIRVFGKKELAQLSVIDLVFILLISNAVQNAMVGNNTSLLGGLAAATALFLTNHLLKLILFRFKSLSQIIQGSPVLLIYEGKIQQEGLNQAKLSMQELQASLREHGISEVQHVNLAVLEIDGNISVLSEDYQHRTSKRRKNHRAILKNV